MSILNQSLAVLEYSTLNMSNLAQKGLAYPLVFHLPLGALTPFDADGPTNLRPQVQTLKNKVLFYGDTHCERRQRFLDRLKDRFNLVILNNAFGEEAQEAVKSAAVVVNIHYHEKALLESTRIYECLSLGAHIVSEETLDLDDYPGLSDQVTFTPLGDIEAMEKAIELVLKAQEASSDSNALDREAYLQSSQNRFRLMLYRTLHAHHYLNHEQFECLALEVFTFDEALRGVCLSMPETTHRRDQFKRIRPKGFQIFDGVRNTTGWIGCASSYRFLCKAALKAGLDQLLVCEDDVILPPHFDEQLQTIKSFLNQDSIAWDIFAGLISNLHPNTQVFDVQTVNGLTFVTIDKMTSTVFNIYKHSAMELISRWDPNFKNAELNTIDRYLESQADLKIVTLLDPLFGHREDMNSTLWGFENTQYTDWISASQTLLQEKVKAFLAKSQNSH